MVPMLFRPLVVAYLTATDGGLVGAGFRTDIETKSDWKLGEIHADRLWRLHRLHQTYSGTYLNPLNAPPNSPVNTGMGH